MPSEVFLKLAKDNGDYAAKERKVGVFVKANGHLAPTAINHVGLIFFFQENDESGNEQVAETRELHFINNHRMINKELNVNAQYVHAPMSLDSFSASQFAAYLTAVSRRYRGAPPILYGLDWSGSKDCFDKEGEYIRPDDIAGLTCATFVSELLAGYFRLQPVVVEEWPQNEERDIQWRDEMLAEYRRKITEGKSQITLDQVDRMAAIDPFIRLRPEQIAAAATSDKEWPIGYQDVQALANQVAADFESLTA